AGSIRRSQAVAGWLYRVAHRVAVKAERNMARRRVQERKAEPRQVGRPEAEVGWRELQAVLQEELERLPDKYRVPFLLCCLERRPGPGAAGRRGGRGGTVRGGWGEARKLPRRRLARRGVLLSAVLAAAVSRAGAAVAVGALAERTVTVALAFTHPAGTAGA